MKYGIWPMKYAHPDRQTRRYRRRHSCAACARGVAPFDARGADRLGRRAGRSGEAVAWLRDSGRIDRTRSARLAEEPDEPRDADRDPQGDGWLAQRAIRPFARF